MPTFDQNFCLSLGDFYEKCANISMKVLRKLYKSCTIPLKSLKPKFGHFWANKYLRQPAFFFGTEEVNNIVLYFYNEGFLSGQNLFYRIDPWLRYFQDLSRLLWKEILSKKNADIFCKIAGNLPPGPLLL